MQSCGKCEVKRVKPRRKNEETAMRAEEEKGLACVGNRAEGEARRR